MLRLALAAKESRNPRVQEGRPRVQKGGRVVSPTSRPSKTRPGIQEYRVVEVNRDRPTTTC